MSGDIEQYRKRYNQRPETFDAYEDVWHRVPLAQRHFSSWAIFSQVANAEPRWRRDKPEQVELADDIMKSAGYVLGTPTTRGARRWVRSDSASTASVPSLEEAAPKPATSTLPTLRELPDAPFADAVLSSATWNGDSVGGRARLDDARVRGVFAALHAGGGVASFDAVSASTGIPVGRVSGFLVAIAKRINQPETVMLVDPDHREVRLALGGLDSVR